MKEKYGKIQYDDKEYIIAFNLNVMEAIQDEYGSLAAWGELSDAEEPNFKAVIFGLREMLNEGIDISNEKDGTDIPHFTHKQVGRILSEIGINNVAQKMNATVIDSTEEDEPKNGSSTKKKK